MKLDVSDEEISNWMRFVRPAERYSEQNLILHQDEHGQLYFTATRTINPRQELKVWYSPDYAQARGLQLLSPGPMDLGEYQIFWGVFTASNAQRSFVVFRSTVHLRRGLTPRSVDTKSNHTMF